MAPIQTTAGPVEVSELGRTLVHEHLNSASEGVRFQWPHLVDHDAETARAVAQVEAVQAHGVQTICDPAVLDLARDVQLHLRVQEQTGMRFVLATEEGVAPGKVLVAHTGDTADMGYVRELLDTGVRVGMDRYGLDAVFGPGQPERNQTVKAVVDAGLGDRLVLGQDHCASIDWYPAEAVAQLAPKWSFHLIFDEAIPELLELGVAQEQLDAMVGANVHAWLAA